MTKYLQFNKISKIIISDKNGRIKQSVVIQYGKSTKHIFYHYRHFFVVFLFRNLFDSFYREIRKYRYTNKYLYRRL